MTKWYFFHILESCTHSHTHKQSIYVYTKKSFGISKFHRLLQQCYTRLYIEESESRSVEEGGESKVACCQALCSPKAEKAYTQQTLCVFSVLYHALFSLCSILLSHTYIISLLYLVKQHSYQAAKYYFFRFILLAVWYAFSFFLLSPQKFILARYSSTTDLPHCLCLFYEFCCIILTWVANS